MLGELLKRFLFVHSCWQDPKMAVKHKMTYERAISELRDVEKHAKVTTFGARLAWRASQLLGEICKTPMEVDFKEASGN